METIPNYPELKWQPASSDIKIRLDELDEVCKKEDGSEPVSRFTEEICDAAGQSYRTICGMAENQIVAAGWVLPFQAENGEQRFHLVGRVHPSYRRKGIGKALLEWEELCVHQAGEKGSTLALIIPNEAVVAGADTLYEQSGYSQAFAEKMMVCDLAKPLFDVPLAAGFHTAFWSDASAHDFFHAYQIAFYDRLGWLDQGEEGWIRGNSDDADFLPGLSRVVYAGEEPVAFITCFSSGPMGWIGQIGVAPDQRRGYIASALLAMGLKDLRGQGFAEAGLHVNINNSRAQNAFREAGFTCRLTRARYIKRVPSGN